MRRTRQDSGTVSGTGGRRGAAEGGMSALHPQCRQRRRRARTVRVRLFEKHCHAEHLHLRND